MRDVERVRVHGRGAALLALLVLMLPVGGDRAAVPGLPFTETFDDDALRDAASTDADWDTAAGELRVGARVRRAGPIFGQTMDQAQITADADATRSLLFEDFDGDGDRDLVAISDPQSRYYPSDGDGDPWNLLAGGTDVGPSGMTGSGAAGDVDGDGRIDLVLTFAGAGNLLLLNNGTADPFGGVVGSAIGIETDDTYAVALGDVDADGDLDLITGNYLGVNRLYLNNGTPDPFGGVGGLDVTADAIDTSFLELADVDGDGDLDLLEATLGVNRLFLNDGAGDPWDTAVASPIGAVAASTNGLALGDLDGDGDLDLVTANDLAEDRVYLNDGSADPWGSVTPYVLEAASLRSISVALGDTDSDGDLDAVIGTFGGTLLRYENRSRGPRPLELTTSVVVGDPMDTSGDTSRVLLEDIDDDGDLDVLRARFDGANEYFTHDGGLIPFDDGPCLQITSEAGSTTESAFADFDGDGDLDYVAGGAGQTRYFENDGDLEPWSIPGVGVSTDSFQTFDIDVGDLDGDGDLDLATANNTSGIRIYLNNGTANPWNFVSGVTVGVTGTALESIALGDIDGDGDLDIVAGNDNAQGNVYYLNNGSPTPFAGVGPTPAGVLSSNTVEVELADVDVDGDLDLIVANRLQFSRLYFNNGSPTPWVGETGQQIGTFTSNAEAMEVGDLNGDGLLDLVIGSNGSSSVVYYRAFNPTNPWPAGITFGFFDSAQVRDIQIGDFDRDGDRDLITVSVNKSVLLYRNDGLSPTPVDGGSTSDAIGPQGFFSFRTVDFADFDGDGDRDLALGALGANCMAPMGGLDDPWYGSTSSALGAEADVTRAVVVADLDGDGDDDVATIGDGQNRLYANSGGPSPTFGAPADLGGLQLNDSTSVALGDVDGDGYADLVVGNDGSPNRIYDGDEVLFGWNGSDIGADSDATAGVALGDVDGDGDLDLVAGNDGVNRYYENNGIGLGIVAGADLTTDADTTTAIALGDVDGDGDLDTVVGNDGVNRWYANNGGTMPWSTAVATDISTDAHDTRAIALVDVDRDGDLDLVVGNFDQTNRLYLNDGSLTPFAGAVGSDIGTAADSTTSLLVTDIDADGDADLLVGNASDPDRLHFGDPATPWGDLLRLDLDDGSVSTNGFAVGDPDLDGQLEVVAATASTNELRAATAPVDGALGRAVSLRVDAEVDPVLGATLTEIADLPPGSSVDYWLSNDAGVSWKLAVPGRQLLLDTAGNDLRWRAELRTGSPVAGPAISQLDIAGDIIAPIAIGNRVWEDLDGDGIQDPGEPGIVAALVYLFDGSGGFVDVTFTDANGEFLLDGLVWRDDYFVRFIPPPGYVLSPADQGGDEALDSDADPATGDTPVFELFGVDNHTRWDAGMVPSVACVPPDEPVYISGTALTPDGNDYIVVTFLDPNQPTQISGYNVYRSSDPGIPVSSWPLVASDVIDMDEATPNKQWIDTSGDVSPSGIWYYQVTAYNHRCPAASAEGPF